jgi:hypothetical protein
VTKQSIKNFYWVKDKLLAGEYPGDADEEIAEEKIDALIKVGVTAFIDLTESTDGLLPYDNLLNHRDITASHISDFLSGMFRCRIRKSKPQPFLMQSTAIS